MSIITLTTDFGLVDGYVGIMKGVILGIAPDARLVDLSHEIPPQDVRQAALLLARATPVFPHGAAHLAVVDPGVGTARRPLVVSTPRATYVGPDNGIFTSALGERGAQAWELDRPEYWLAEVSQTFHGRDVFAPVAAHLARGVPPEALGRPVQDPVRLALRPATRARNGEIAGEVATIDRFGNLITNIPGTWVTTGRWGCHIAGQQVEGISATYADVAPGMLVVLVGSSGTLEIAVRDGNAATVLSVQAEAGVTLTPL